MTPLAAIALALLGAIDVTVSPDQPLPYSYTDDPLIVEVRSDEPCVASIRLTATPRNGLPPAEARFDDMALGPNAGRWCAIKDIGNARGPWTLEIAVETGGNTERIETTAYRLDRPEDAYAHPIEAYGDHVDRNTLLALRSVAINSVRVPLDHPKLRDLLDTMATLDMGAIIDLNGMAPSDDLVRAIGQDHCDAIRAWLLPLASPRGADNNLLGTLRDLDCQKPVRFSLQSLRVAGTELERLGNGRELLVPGDPDNLGSLQEALAMRGLNGLPVNAVLSRDTVTHPTRFLPSFFELQAQGASSVSIPVELIYADGRLQPGLARVNTLMHRIVPADYAGRIPQPGTSRAQIFATGDRWLAATWRRDTESTLAFPWSGEHPFALMDEWGNGLESNAGEGGRWTHPLDNDFLYIMGLGGPVLKDALVHRATGQARALTGDDRLDQVWSPALQETLAAIEEDPADVSSRVQFFALLRAFPEIEERWHAGELTRPVATTALARLGFLARTLCKLEAAQGASFLEPLQDTLARCEEFQSAYLTSATTTTQARARGDWLVAEVRRLMDEAEALAQLDRRIEADAVAALAEWRARGLVFAAKAGPLSDRLVLPDAESDEDAAANGEQ